MECVDMLTLIGGWCCVGVIKLIDVLPGVNKYRNLPQLVRVLILRQ
jgi:hypothetical protein